MSRLMFILNQTKMQGDAWSDNDAQFFHDQQRVNTEIKQPVKIDT